MIYMEKNEGKSSMMGWLRGKPLELMLEAEKIYSSEGKLSSGELDALAEKVDSRLKLKVFEFSNEELVARDFHKLDEFVTNFKKERDLHFPSYRFFCAVAFFPVDKNGISREEWFSRGFGSFWEAWERAVVDNFHKNRFEEVSYPVSSGLVYVGILLATREAYLEHREQLE